MKIKSKLSKFDQNKNLQKGFVATLAVTIMATGVIYFSLMTLSSALVFSDIVNKKELRIQANLNAKSCLNQIILMASRDYFLSGQVTLKDFGCISNISNDLNGNLAISGSVTFGGVNIVFNQKIVFSDNLIKII